MGRISILGGQNPREVRDGSQSCYTELFWYYVFPFEGEFSFLVYYNSGAQTQMGLGRTTLLFSGCRDKIPGE